MPLYEPGGIRHLLSAPLWAGEQACKDTSSLGRGECRFRHEDLIVKRDIYGLDPFALLVPPFVKTKFQSYNNSPGLKLDTVRPTRGTRPKNAPGPHDSVRRVRSVAPALTRP